MTLLELLQDPDLSKFSLDKVQFTFPSPITRLSVRNNTMLVLLQKSFLKIQLEQADAVQEIKLSSFKPESCLAVDVSKEGGWICTLEGLFLNGKRVTKLATSAIWINGDVVLIGCPDGSVHSLVGNQTSRVCTVGDYVTGIVCHQNIVIVSTKSALTTFTNLNGIWTERNVQEMQASRIGVKIYSSPIGVMIGWITEAGVLHATLSPDSETMLKNVVMLPMTHSLEQVLQLVLSDFYSWLLTETGITLINRIDQSSTFLQVDLEQGEKVVDGFCDAVQKTFWISTNLNLYEVLVSEESKGMVALLLQKRLYEEAMEVASTQEEKKFVASRFAEDCFARGNLEKASMLYAHSDTWFEQVVLKLMDLDDKTFLVSYLKQKLVGMKENERSQVTMITSLLVETLLCEIDVCRNNGVDDRWYQNVLNDILRHYKEEIHPPTIYSLLKQHGNQTILLHTAELLKDLPLVVEMYIQREAWGKALEVLGKQSNPELFYRFGPVLVQNSPKETITLWSRCDFLNPRLLIPSMLYYKHEGREQNQIMMYLEEVIRRGNSDKVVHNFLVQMYVESGDSSSTRLLNFIDSGEPIFDVQYALRLCIHHGLVRPCVALYGILHMEREAVKLALKSNDIDLARSIVNGLDDEDEDVKVNLVIQIMEHVITKDKDFKLAIQLSKDHGIKIETVLNMFPDFVRIDNVKEDIVEVLKDYNLQLSTVSKELDESARNAESIRASIRGNKEKFVVIPVLKSCDVCNRKLLTRQFHVFPCFHGFHSDCLVDQLMKHPIKATRIRILQNQVDKRTKEELEALIGEECTLCGEMMIRALDQVLTDTPDVL